MKVRELDNNNLQKLFSVAENRLKDVNIPHDELESAYKATIDIFGEFEAQLSGGFFGFEWNEKNHIHPISIESAVLGLTHALLYFKNNVPQSLRKKLTNRPQSEDTIFELLCMGRFLKRHKVIYEPKVETGKHPDLMIKLINGLDIYLECKTQHPFKNKIHKTFNCIASKLLKIIDGTAFQKNAWSNDCRIELYVIKTPNENEILQFERDLMSFRASINQYIGAFYKLQVVHRSTPFNDLHGINMRNITVAGPQWTTLADENFHSVVYSWKGLEDQLRRLQRKLLTSARIQLRGIPAGSVGMICLEVQNVKKFIPDVQSALSRPEFNSIPLIWLNPRSSGQIVCRNDALWVRNSLFNL